MAEQRLVGKKASSGYAVGPVAVLTQTVAAFRVAGERKDEAEALRSAIAAAGEELANLASAAKGNEAEIIAFQIAMLEDDALAETAFASIEAGLAADLAWKAAIDHQISEYESATDAHLAKAASMSEA